MKLKNKNTNGNKNKLTFLASIICVSAFLTGCNDDEKSIEVDEKSSDVAVKTTEKPVIKPETNANRVASDIAQKVHEAKEDLKSFDAKNIAKEVGLTSNEKSKEIVISDIYVVDGDTVYGVDKAGKKLKVRMTGIDAPESSQPMGEESKEALKQCLGMNENALLVVQLDNASDKYGRTLAKVESGGINCNQQQIEKGMAWFYEGFSDKLADGDKDMYKQAQDYAKENTMGIWAMDLQKPWEYRQENMH